MKIKDIRKMAGLNIADFSRVLDIPRRTIEDWEAGKRYPAKYVSKMIERIICEDFGIRYFVLSGTERDEDVIGPFTNLDEANRAAEDEWDHYTAREKKTHYAYVLDARKSDLEDEDDWETWTGDGGYIDGRFDSREL